MAAVNNQLDYYRSMSSLPFQGTFSTCDNMAKSNKNCNDEKL